MTKYQQHPRPNSEKLIVFCARLLFLAALSYYSVKLIKEATDPDRKQKKRTQILLEKLNLQDRDLCLNYHELRVAANLVCPDDVKVDWNDIAGLDEVIDQVKQTVLLPIRLRLNSELLSAPKGVLLHGPPGCGKTLIAKAVAKKAGARFINVDLSQLTSKWYGESLKMATAVFTLARKVEPCIIFVDEIDGLLRERCSSDYETTCMIKTQFMQLWDGLENDPNASVVVMGATNRPEAIDSAILRRLPATFYIGKPESSDQRGEIFRSILRKENVSGNVDFQRLGEISMGFSGSDIREVCRLASVYRLNEIDPLKPEVLGMFDEANETAVELRSITNADLEKAVEKVGKSRLN